MSESPVVRMVPDDPGWPERERLREGVRTAVGEALGKYTRLSRDPQFGQLVDVVASAACDAAGLPLFVDYVPAAVAYATMDDVSFVACECDRIEDVRIDGECIADGEVERLHREGWEYDGLAWLCPNHAGGACG
jgi:hypothetical protein